MWDFLVSFLITAWKSIIISKQKSLIKQLWSHIFHFKITPQVSVVSKILTQQDCWLSPPDQSLSIDKGKQNKRRNVENYFKTSGVTCITLKPYIRMWFLPGKVHRQVRLWEAKTQRNYWSSAFVSPLTLPGDKLMVGEPAAMQNSSWTKWIMPDEIPEFCSYGDPIKITNYF